MTSARILNNNQKGESFSIYVSCFFILNTLSFKIKKKDLDKESYLVTFDDAPFCSGANRYTTSRDTKAHK